MIATTNQKIADLFSGKFKESEAQSLMPSVTKSGNGVTFSYLFFSDVRKDISDIEKYRFMRELVEFADQSGFEAVYFPERHFHEFGSIHANNSITAAYFAPITKNVRLRAAAVTATLHHPIEIVENWAMVDILSNGRVDLGFGNGWNKSDFVLSPDSYKDRVVLRNQRIPLIQQLWRGESVDFPGPDGEIFSVKSYPRPLQPELNVWYVTTSKEGFEHAGKQGYNVFTMLSGMDLNELGNYIEIYCNARALAGMNAESGIVSLMMHTFVHPDIDWVQRCVAEPFKDYIRSSLLVHMKAVGKNLSNDEVQKMLDYSYARYFQTGGIFGTIEDCQQQIDKAKSVGVNDIAFLQDFGIEYSAVKKSLVYLKQLVDTCNKSYSAKKSVPVPSL